MAVDLNSVQDVIDHLNKPENQIGRSTVFIIKWEGSDPKISTLRLKELNDPNDRGLAEVVLIEHRRRKTRPQEQEVIEND